MHVSCREGLQPSWQRAGLVSKRETDRQAENQADGRTDGRTEGQADRQTDGQAGRQAGRKIKRQTEYRRKDAERADEHNVARELELRSSLVWKYLRYKRKRRWARASRTGEGERGNRTPE